MMKILLLCLLSICFARPTMAVADYWMLTDLGSSAETIGMGGVEGFSKSANNVFENPASLYQIKRGSVSVFTTKIIEEIDYVNASVATRLPIGGVVGVGYMEASVRDIPFTARNSDRNQTHFAQYHFDYRNSITKLSYQFSTSRWFHVGASLVRYTNNFDSIAGTGTNADLGIAMDFQRLDVSILIRNLMDGENVEYNDGSVERLPLQLITGAQYDAESFMYRFEMKKLDSNTLFSAGVTYFPSEYPYLSVSGGYKEFEVLNEVKDTVVLGLMLRLGDLEFHYAYEKSDHFEFDNKSYFSMSFGY